PEQVALREIVVSTEGKKPEELPDLKKKAETALKRVQDGEDFGEIAKRLSDGSTKSQGGFLGIYKRGELSKELEDKVFQMKRNQLTEVMQTRFASRAKASPSCAWSLAIAAVSSRRVCGINSTSWPRSSVATISSR